MAYDSRPETEEHVNEVRKRLMIAISNLESRAAVHDSSKSESPELEYFDKFTPLLSTVEYGSDEYKQFLVEMQPALDHHYSHNDHHPQFYENGIRGMSLLSLLELIADWSAASLRSPNGDIRKSIEINQSRYGYSDDLKEILMNTVKELDL